MSRESNTQANSQTAQMARLGLLVVGLLACGAAAFFLGPQLWGSRTSAPAPTAIAVVTSAASATPAPPTQTPTPLPPTPTFPCGQPTLTLGSTTFQIYPIARAADGSLALPPDTPNAVYWVEGTSTNYVFALSAAPDNLALETSLQAGDRADIGWGDCSSEEYVIAGIESGPPNFSALFDQSTGGITVFVQTGPSAAGLVIRGGRPEAQVVDTPSPTDANAIQAEISFLDTTTSPDAATLTLSIAIKNTGPTAFTISESDISLTAEGAEPLAPVSVTPALPVEVQPGASETFSISFPKPAANTAVFRILDFSVDIFI